MQAVPFFFAFLNAELMFNHFQEKNSGSKGMTVSSKAKLITYKILKASGFSFNLKLAPIMMFHLATALESLDY